MKRIFAIAALVAALAVAAVTASATTIHVPADQPTLAAALAAAAPNDVILVSPGTYVLGAGLAVTTANLTLQGSGIGATVIQAASGIGDAITVSASGFTLRDLTLEKTDLPDQHLIVIYASGCTIRDNDIHGPDPGTPWSANGIVSRAIVGAGGITGMLIQNNQIHHLRQPGYFSAPNDGSILGNAVGGTRGWVVEGAALTFSGNTFGTPEDQGADIALLSMCNPADYPDLLALSAANGNAYISAQWVGASSGRAHAYVDAAAAPGGWGSVASRYQAVQAGVNGTLPGGTVHVAAGTYTEQVVVNGKNLTVQGAGRALTTIQSPLALAASFPTPGNSNFPVVLARDAADVRFLDLTVDGAGRGNGNYRFQGVGFYNAGGKLLHADVKGIRETPFSGTQHGVAVYAYNITGGPYALEVGDVAITDFQKNATVFAGTGLTVAAHDLTVTGAGPTAVTAQNGIQVSSGASATVTNAAVSSIFYSPETYLACGLIAFGPGTVSLSGTNTFAGCQTGLYFQDGDGSATGTSVSGASWGAIAYNLAATTANGARPARAEGSRTPPPAEAFDAGLGASSAARASASALASLVTVSLADGCLLGSDLANTAGLYAYSAGGGLNVSLTGMEVKDWDVGVVCDGPVSLTAQHDAFTSNLSAGLDNTTSGAAQTATLNWWGSSSGPGGVGGGSGDAVLGANVAFGSWLISGADANAGCGFSVGPDNVITPGPAPSCLSAANTCVTIPVTIARTTADGMRGFSVTVQLSSNLVLCGTSITEGSYLLPGTAFQVVDNGGGSYTVDAATLGLPCGATASGGTLFSLQVAKAPLAPNGTGTVTIGTVLARDCANAPIAVSAGAPLSITIDGTAPVAIANLTATQKKTGNDADGTTKIQLAFTAPVDAATVEVYRAPYGPYPEYDDAGGAAPAAPSYPPGSPWTLTAVTATGQTDEPATRNLWYYVAFTKDACGNVSAVSNRTNGTLDYHLGDVVDPGNPLAVGDNQVGSGDVSRLGAHYGITLVFNDPYNYLDVGPTTDYSVNARPTTDNRVNFEDLMMFAINYGQVSMPQDAVVARAASRDAIGLTVPALPEVGQLFAVPVTAMGAGDVQGASIRYTYDASVVEPVGVEAGELLMRQSHPTVALSPSPGIADFALLGEGAGLAGEGEALRLLFRVKAAGDARIAIAEVTARDAANRPIALGGAPVVGPVTPARTELGMAYPNPFGSTASIALSLAREAKVRVVVFDLSGRRVRTLLDGVQPAGERLLTWDGRNDAGTRLAAGMYLIRLETAGVTQNRRLQLVP